MAQNVAIDTAASEHELAGADGRAAEARSRLQSPKLHEGLVAQVCRDIVSGRMEPGAPLPSEPELIATYGVSKTVVREAVQALAALGLVRVQHGKRSVVLGEPEWNILSPLVQEAYRVEGDWRSLVDELYAVRLVLEPEAARWMAKRASRDEREAMRALMAAMETSLGSSADRKAVFLDYDRRFHLMIATAAGNRVLRAVVRDIHELLNTSWLFTQLSDRDLMVVFRQHSAVADAIIGRDGAGASRAMRKHLEWAANADRSGTD